MSHEGIYEDGFYSRWVQLRAQIIRRKTCDRFAPVVDDAPISAIAIL
jgi:hypothetical protein